MENTEITTIAKNISSLKSIFGDRIVENAELLKYMKRKGVIEEIKKVHKYAISPHSRGFYTKVNDPRPDDPSHRKTIIEPTEEEIYIRLAEWYGLNDRQKKITVDDIYHKWMIRREEEKVEANTRERNDQHYRRYFKGTAFFKRDIRTISRSEWKTFCLKVISGETVRDEAYQSMAPECKRITHHE